MTITFKDSDGGQVHQESLLKTDLEAAESELAATKLQVRDLEGQLASNAVRAGVEAELVDELKAHETTKAKLAEVERGRDSADARLDLYRRAGRSKVRQLEEELASAWRVVADFIAAGDALFLSTVGVKPDAQMASARVGWKDARRAYRDALASAGAPAPDPRDAELEKLLGLVESLRRKLDECRASGDRYFVRMLAVKDLTELDKLLDALASAGTDACSGCGYPSAKCRPLWRNQRKCCPDCSHGTDADRTEPPRPEAGEGGILACIHEPASGGELTYCRRCGENMWPAESKPEPQPSALDDWQTWAFDLIEERQLPGEPITDDGILRERIAAAVTKDEGLAERIAVLETALRLEVGEERFARLKAALDAMPGQSLRPELRDSPGSGKVEL